MSTARAGVLGLGLLALLQLALVPAARAAEAEPSALVQLADQLAGDLARARPEPPVGLFVQAPAPLLAQAIETLLGERLARLRLGPVLVIAPSPEAAELSARARGLHSLARLSLRVERAELSARGDVVGTWVNFWSGAHATRTAGTAAVLQRAVPADAEALALAQPGAQPGSAPSLRLVPSAFARLPARAAAVAAADWDEDGRAEVAVLTDDEVLVYAPSGKLLARFDHRGLDPAEAPCREPFGAIVLEGPPARVHFHSSRRARAETLLFRGGQLRLAGAGQQTELTVALTRDGPVTARLTPGENTFDPPFRRKGVELPALTERLHGLSFGAATSASAIALGLLPGGGGVVTRLGAGDRLRIGSVGAGSALIDVDADGTLELLASSTAAAPEPDELRLHALQGIESAAARTGQANLRELPALWIGTTLRGRAMHVVAADFDGDRTDEALVAVWLSDGTGELELLRRVTP